MAYQDLGPRTVLGVQDGTIDSQFNPYLPGTGWIVLVRPQDLNTNETNFECYQVSLNGPVGSSALMSRDGKPWNFIQQAWNNYNDPQQPLPMRQTSYVQFAWNVPFVAGPYNQTNNIQPTVTLWLRKELEL